MALKGQKTSNKVKEKIRETKRIRRESGYYDNPKLCLLCNKKLNLSQSQKKFCSLAHCYEYKRLNPKTNNFCKGCGVKVGQYSLRCKKCSILFHKEENSTNWKGGVSTNYCVDCGKLIFHHKSRCRKCFDIFNKGENNSMFGRKGEKCNHWDNTIEDCFCDSCGKKLKRGRSRRNRESGWEFKVCIACYSGKYTPRYLGGVRYYGKGWTLKLKKSIKERDNYSCRNPYCEKKSNLLTVHHIDYDKKNNDNLNLITLCQSCHSKTNTNREYWKKLFMNLEEKIYENFKKNRKKKWEKIGRKL